MITTEVDDRGEDRGWWDRASDEVASWFGDEEAERRRRMDAQRKSRSGTERITVDPTNELRKT
jgi:osmotically-inducible protein OsmY